MTSEEAQLAVLKNEQKNLERRIDKLEQSNRWGITAILGIVLATVAEFLKGGGL
jgi:cell division protein FtsB